jgi:hypothetical protein
MINVWINVPYPDDTEVLAAESMIGRRWDATNKYGDRSWKYDGR